MSQVKQITVSEVSQKLDKKEKFKLVDVREQQEYDLCRIEGSLLIPLSEFQARAEEELNQDEEIVIHCHHGGRSQQACEYLVSQGYQNVSNLQGGIHAWSVEVDSKMARY